MFDKRILRTLQTHLPDVRPAKFGFYNFCTRHLGRPVDDEFLQLPRLGTVALALDIGGNWGQSIEALRRFAKAERIVSFEPNPELNKRLETRFSEDGDVAIEGVALSDAAGEMTLFVPVYNGFVFDGLASLDRSEAENWLSADRMVGFERARLQVREYRVQIRTLDSYGYRPQVVKLDVQGLEAAVIRGGKATFAECQPSTIVESPSEEVVALMTEFGLSPFHVSAGRLEPGLGKTKNAMFLSRDAQAKVWS